MTQVQHITRLMQSARKAALTEGFVGYMKKEGENEFLEEIIWGQRESSTGIF